MRSIDVLTQQMEMVEDYIAIHWAEFVAQAHQAATRLPNISRVLIGGCGDSHHAGLGVALSFSVYPGVQVLAMEAMQLARYAPSLFGPDCPSTLVIGISSSGEVARTIEALEIWQALGAPTLAITSSATSSLARTAQDQILVPAANLPVSPGLLSHIGSLLAGYACASCLGGGAAGQRLIELVERIPELLQVWRAREQAKGAAFAHQVAGGAAVVLGSGPAQGSARFGAAKVIEAAGEPCWAQDVEEWAHLEYFCEPAGMTTILLGCKGRSSSREAELLEAMRAIGRTILHSEWSGGSQWSPVEREALAPLALWVAPCAYASERARILEEEPFRGFGGGRDRHEGGGASRIRSSQRLSSRELLLSKPSETKP